MSRLDKLKERFPELNVPLIDILAKADPTDTYKYCDFIINNFINNTQKDSPTMGIVRDVDIQTLKRFETHSKANRIENKDISQHKTFETIIKEVHKADEIVKQKEIEKQTTTLYKDDEWLVIIPLTYEASALYGKNTKWCITQKTYWSEYSRHSKIIFVLNRKTDEKYAISNRYSEKKIEGWDAQDKCVNPLIWEFTDEVWAAVRKELRLTRQETELRRLGGGEDKILSSKGIVDLKDATEAELTSFKKKYEKHISESFLKKINKLLSVKVHEKPTTEKIIKDITSTHLPISGSYDVVTKNMLEYLKSDNINDLIRKFNY